MIEFYRQGIKCADWAPLIAKEFSCSEEAAKKDWSRRKWWINCFIQLDNPSNIALDILGEIELLHMDVFNLFEVNSENPHILLQLLLLRLKIIKEKQNFLENTGAADVIRAEFDHKKQLLASELELERYPHRIGNHDEYIREQVIKKVGKEMPGNI
jgi:hypothetical protein